MFEVLAGLLIGGAVGFALATIQTPTITNAIAALRKAEASAKQTLDTIIAHKAS